MSISPRDLMRYHDGELSPGEARDIEQALDDDDEAQEHLLALEQLGDLTRAWAEQRSADQVNLVDGVMARIERQKSEPSPLAPARRAAPIVASVLALAAAAALFVTLRRPVAERAVPTQPSAHSVRLVDPKPSPSEARSADAPLAEPAVPAPAVAIEAVDFGENHGSIFVVSSASGDTPVVWLSEGPAISPPRTHPL